MLIELRKKIADEDQKILQLLAQRKKLVAKVAQEKKLTGKKIHDLKREKNLLNELKKIGKEKGLSAKEIEKIWQVIFEFSYEKQKKIMNDE